MTRRVQLVDTSILDELLDVPGKADESEFYKRELEERQQGGVRFHLPAAALFQVGMHVSRLNDGRERRSCAERLAGLIRMTVDGQLPWTFTPLDWNEQLLRELIDPSHPNVLSLVESLTHDHLEIGDLLIVHEFVRLRSHLDSRIIDLDVWTKDDELHAIIQSIR